MAITVDALELTVKTSTETAADSVARLKTQLEGLKNALNSDSIKNLVQPLKDLKEAVSRGLNLEKAASGFTALGKAVNDDISGSTWAKIESLAQAFEKLKEATTGIDFSGVKALSGKIPKPKVEDVQKAVGQVKEDFSKEAEEYINSAVEAKRISEAYGNQLKQSFSEGRFSLEGIKNLVNTAEKMPHRTQEEIDAQNQRTMEYTMQANHQMHVKYTQLDVSEALKSANADYEKINEAISAYKAEGGNTTKAEQQMMGLANAADLLMHKDKFDFGNQAKSVDEAIQKLKDLKAEAEAAGQSWSDLMQKVNDVVIDGKPLPAFEATPEASGAADGIQKVQQTMKDTENASKELTNGMEGVDNELKNKKNDAEEAASGIQKFKAEMKAAGSALKDFVKNHTVLGSVGNLWKRFARVAGMRAMRYAIRAITSGIKEGVTNLYQWSKAMNGGFSKSMDGAASQLLTMKNAIGTAVAPAIQALIPVFNIVTNAVITASNAIAQFFAIINGSGSWTKATAAPTEFGKAAKGAGGGAKEMLAAFDELNVIASEGGGGGGSSGLDYGSMFEEVYEFDDKIKQVAEIAKEVVGWIADNFDKVLATVVAIKAAIALWEVSKAFSGILSTLSGILAGGVLITLGVVLSYDFGKKLGSGNVSTMDIVEGVAGALSSAIGGALIGFKLGGPWGAVIGAAGGLVVSITTMLIGYVQAKKESWRNAHWGSKTLTPDEVKAYVKKLYSFDVEAEITLMTDARMNLSDAITQANKNVMLLSQTIRRVEIGVETPENLAQKAKDAVDSAIAIYNSYEDLKAIYISVLPQSGLDEKFNGTTGRALIEEAGTELGNILVSAAEGTLTAKQQEMTMTISKWINDVMGGVDDYQKQLEYGTDTRMSLKDFSRGTANQIFKQQTQYDAQWYNEALKSAYQLADAADLQAQQREIMIKEGKDALGNDLTAAEIENLKNEIEHYRAEAKDIRDNAKTTALAKLDTNRAVAREMYKETLADVYGNDLNGAAGKWGNGLYNSSSNTIMKAFERGDTEKALNEFNYTMKRMLEDIDPVLIDISQYYGLTGWDLLEEEGRKNLVNSMKRILDADGVVTLLKGSFNLDINEVIETYGWDELTRDEQWELVHALVQAYGADAVPEIAKRTELNVYGMLNVGGYDELEEAEQDNFIRAMVYAYGSLEVYETLKSTGRKIPEWLAEGMASSDSIQQALGATKYEIEQAGIDMQWLLDHWDLIAPTIEKYPIKDALDVIQKISKESGLSTQDIIENWNLVAPLIDESHIDESVGDISKTIKDSGPMWKEALKVKLDSPSIDYSNTTSGANFVTKLLGLFRGTWVGQVSSPLQTADVTTPNNFGDNAIKTAKNLYQNVKDTISGTLNILVGVKSNGSKVETTTTTSGWKKIISLTTLRAANGAFDIPSGQLFISREAGPELVGKIGNRTSVANNEQIVRGIASGVAQSMQGVEQRLARIEQYAGITASKDTTVKITPSAALGRVNAQSAAMYDRAGGR